MFSILTFSLSYFLTLSLSLTFSVHKAVGLLNVLTLTFSLSVLETVGLLDALALALALTLTLSRFLVRVTARERQKCDWSARLVAPFSLSQPLLSGLTLANE